MISDVSDIAAEYGSKTYIHLSETLKEVGDCTVRHNRLTPPQYLHKLGFFENGGLAAHCTYCDKDDLALLKQCGVVPVVNAAKQFKTCLGRCARLFHAQIGHESGARDGRLREQQRDFDVP